MQTERKSIEKVNAEKHALVAQGAEAKIYSGSFYGKKCIAKERFAKNYRHPTLDAKLRETRTIREARALLKATRYGIHVPMLWGVDKDSCTLWMEKIDGCTVKELLDKEDTKQKPLVFCSNCGNNLHSVKNKSDECEGNHNNSNNSSSSRLSELTIRLLTEIGQVVGQMHNHNIIHGDLTTSNFMYCMSAEEIDDNIVTTHKAADNITVTNNKEAKSNLKMLINNNNSSSLRARNRLVVLDFGLINEKNSVEERAVDLFVLEKAIMATHPFIVDNCDKTESRGNTNAIDNLKGVLHVITDEEYGSCNGDSHADKCQGSINGVDYIYRGYMSAVTDTKRCEATLARLATVRARGRKRSMIG